MRNTRTQETNALRTWVVLGLAAVTFLGTWAVSGDAGAAWTHTQRVVGQIS